MMVLNIWMNRVRIIILNEAQSKECTFVEFILAGQICPCCRSCIIRMNMNIQLNIRLELFISIYIYIYKLMNRLNVLLKSLTK